MGYLLAFLIIIATSVAGAESPPACAKNEQPVVCMLKVERNNAMDELALAQAFLIQEQEARKHVDEYWKNWVEGDRAKDAWWDRLWHSLRR